MIEFAISALTAVTVAAGAAALRAYRAYQKTEISKPYRIQLLATAKGLIDAHGADSAVRKMALDMIRLAADPSPEWHDAVASDPPDDILPRLEKAYGGASDEILTGICLMATIHLIEKSNLERSLRGMAFDDPMDWVGLLKVGLAKPQPIEIVEETRGLIHLTKRGLPEVVRVTRQFEGGLIAA